MTEPKDGPWRGNPHYLHRLFKQANENAPLTQVSLEKELNFPKHLDWENPSKDQQKWMQRILAHSPEAYLDIFQEYGLIRKDGEATRLSDSEAERKIRLSTAMSGRGRNPGDSILYPIFGEEFADYFNRPNGKWHMFLYADNVKGVPKVIGGVRCMFAIWDEHIGMA